MVEQGGDIPGHWVMRNLKLHPGEFGAVRHGDPDPAGWAKIWRIEKKFLYL